MKQMKQMKQVKQVKQVKQMKQMKQVKQVKQVKQMKQMKLVEIQFFDHSHNDFDDAGTVVRVKQYSANVAIETQDKSFVVQLYGQGEDGDECDVSIPSPGEQCWNSEEDQAWAVENFTKYDILNWLEAQGIENTFDWLDANADDHI